MILSAAIVFYASEYAFFDDEVVTICINPLKTPSKKTNLQMMLERLKFLVQKAFHKCNKQLGDFVEIPVYIMTSEKHNELIYNYLQQINFLGFSNLFVFPQKDLPAFNEKGEIIMKNPRGVHLFPNGSGGLFNCIQTFDLINHL